MVAIKKKISYLPDGAVDIDAWLNNVTEKYHLKNTDLLAKTAHFAETACKGLSTFYGQSCIEQGLEMAEIILDLKLDPTTAAAAIIASTTQHTSVNIETISANTTSNIAQLITSFLQINAINNLAKTTRDPIQIDRLRKLLLAMVSDIRAVLIKLAERTCIMRGIKKINPIERKIIAQETMDIYAPLANRLGIGQLKWELEDFAFHYTNPEAYKKIASFLAERRTDRENRINTIISRVKEQLAHTHTDANIAGRAKHIYSIYLKMQKKHLDYKDIYDYSAVRIIVPTLEDCYTALSIVHHLWEHIPEEFDDYISNPKSNGYRSIHTAVIGPDGKNLEIQIRSQEMHEQAEHGIAAHWIYKENKPQISGYEAKITFLRQLLAWHKDVAPQDETSDPTKTAVLEDRIYVFTPAGDILDLPKGATPLDFAYHIHSGLGHRCRGAKINGHITTLKHALQTGDRVEIITTQNGTPSRDWLNKQSGYLITARARAKVAHWFKQQDIHPDKATHHLPTEQKQESPVTSPHVYPKKQPVSTSHLQIAGTESLLTRLARCCKPIPGDAIIGYITQGRGVSIHRHDCNNVSHLAPEQEGRVIQVHWNEKHPGSYYADLQIQAYSQNTLKEITSLIANLKIDLIALNSTMSKKNNRTYITMTIQIKSLEQLQQLSNQLSHLPNIADVKRIK